MYPSSSKFENIVSNDIEIVQEPTRTLHRDTYVNKLMADAGAPFDPDAEIFDITDSRPVSLNLQYKNPEYYQKIVSKDVSTAQTSSSASLRDSSRNANESTESISVETKKA